MEFPIETTGEVSVTGKLHTLMKKALTSTVSLHELLDLLKLYSTYVNIHIGIFIFTLLQINLLLVFVVAN